MRRWFCLVYFIIIAAGGKAGAGNLSFRLAAPQPAYPEEQEILLPLTVENTSAETVIFKAQYLQPRENTWLFIGGDYSLEIKVNGRPIEKFTNHMPPEPRPGNLPIALGPDGKVIWQVYFPWYYYPLDLPAEFEVRLVSAVGSSNPVKFSVRPSAGTRRDGSLLINGDFTEGETFPYGWKIDNPNAVWDRTGHLLKYTLDRRTAENEGLWTLSLFAPVTSPAEYTFRMRAQSSAPEIIVFFEGWKIVAGRKRRFERTEFFAHPAGEKGFKDYTCTVKLTAPDVRWLRVKLYTYLSPGEVRFADVSLTK